MLTLIKAHGTAVKSKILSRCLTQGSNREMFDSVLQNRVAWNSEAVSCKGNLARNWKMTDMANRDRSASRQALADRR